MRFSIKLAALLFFSLLFAAFPVRAWAQSASPEKSTPTITPTAAAPDLPKGVITGKIINKNDLSKPVGNLEVMLHIFDQGQNQLGMLHGTSVQDGSFTIADVPFQAGMGYAAAVVYEGTTYYSQIALAESGKTSLSLEVAVYESTTDLSKVQVEQMHVLFNFAGDGIEVKELIALSNLGEQTVKDAVEVPGNNGAKAAVQFPLPEKADFIYFEPQDEGRFLKFPGGFADTSSIAPGQMVSQLLVSYLTPYTTPLRYQLKTTLPVKRVNFVIAKDSGVTLKAEGLGEPETITAQGGQTLFLYKLENVPAGQTRDLTFEGEPVIPKSQAAAAASQANLLNQKTPLFLGLGVFGVALLGGGAFWWVRSSKRSKGNEVDEEGLEGELGENEQPVFDSLLIQIAKLDKAFDQGEVDKDTYNAQRNELKTQAKALLAESEAEITEEKAVSSE